MLLDTVEYRELPYRVSLFILKCLTRVTMSDWESVVRAERVENRGDGQFIALLASCPTR